ncbi:MAG: autotransporter domain-containing protein [Rhodoplanes sp.]
MLLGTTSMAALGLALLATTPSRAIDWTGFTSSDWFTPTNWNPNGVPTLADSVFLNIVAPNPTVLSGAPASINQLAVGQTGTGQLTIANGGVLTSTIGTDIGNQAGSNGTLTVTGAGSTLINGGLLSVGTLGTGTLTIENGGMVSNGGFGGFIGYGAGSQGTVTVTGSGSIWNSSPALRVGGSTLNTNFVPPGPGTGTLTIADGGTVSVAGGAGTAIVAEPAGSTGTLNIGAAPGHTAIAPGFLSAAMVQFGLGNGALNFNHTATDLVFAPLIAGNGSVNVFSGTTILNGSNAYTGATRIDGGALIVNGSIASSPLTTVNSGGLLGGVGTVGNTQINTGGTFAPGPQNAPGSMTVAGNLLFQPGALYLVQLAATASIANVTGTATLAGNVLANFAPGSYFTRQYTILHADGGLSGTTFGGVATNNRNFNASLSYDANDVFLTLTAALGSSVNGLNQNQVNVATSINGFFNSGGALPPNFTSLFGLSGATLATALSQLSGEAATAAQYGVFQLGNEFFALMLDPLVYGRGPSLVAPAGVGPMRLAGEGTQASEIALAYAKVLKEPPAPAPIVWEPRWNVWAGGYGGYNRTQGDPVVVGSHDVTARTGGYGAGIDYRIWPGTTLGVALAGGLTNWGLANGLGGGNSDAFQVGLYGITRSGPAYLAGALAFAEHWMTTDRFAYAGDHLTARFNAQSYGGRIEGGWRFATFLGGVAPYAAVQAQAFHTPAYNELDGTLGGFGLNYDARNGSDTRSELGARFDQALPIATTAVLALNARVAWAHDGVTNPSLMPVFQALPGANFIVNGATPVPNLALTSAGAELRFLNGWAIGGRFDGEFADRAQTYAGTATLRYVW